MGCLAALSCFISRLGERGLPLYRLLRKTECFTWTSEAEEALENLKALLTNAPILVPPVAGEALLIYIAATTQVVSAAIVVERQEEGHALPVQRPIYFISEVLSETKIRYPQIQKLLYAVILTRRKLRHYFESHPMTVVSSFPLGEIIQCREASSMIAKWAVEIMGETISFAPRKVIKSQVLADFVAEWVDTQLPAAPIQPELWTMFFDGSLMKTGAGAGLLFISPLGKHLRYVLRLHFPASNNVAEYEALVNGLHIAIELGVRRLDARGDSQLIIDQVMKNSLCHDPKMEAYCDEVRRLEDKFYELELNHIARQYNETADELAKIASGRTMVPLDVFSRDLQQPSVKTDDTPEPEKASAQPEAPSAQPEAPSAPKGEALRVEEERNGSNLIETGRPRTCNISTKESCPSTKPRLGDWRGVPSRSSYWVTGRSSTTAAPPASSSDAYPSPKARSSYKKYTRGLAVITQRPEPLLETPSDKVSTGRPRWPTPLELSAPAKGVNSTQRQTHLPAQALQTIPITWLFAVWGLDLVGPLQKAPGGYTHLLVAIDKFQVDRGPTPKQHQVRTGGGILHQHHPSLWGPKLHHHRQWHPVHRQKVPGLLRGPPHLSGLGRRSSPHDEWAGRECQWHDSARTQAADLQRPQQARQAMDEGTPLGGLESENNAKPSHGLHAVLSSLWGRGHLAHRFRIRFPEDEGVRQLKQSNRPRRLTGPARRGSGHGLTTLSTVSAVPATLPRPRGSVPRPPGGRLGASAMTRRPRASQAHASLGRAIHHRQDFEAWNIQVGQ
jgi:ribonuclease HI